MTIAPAVIKRADRVAEHFGMTRSEAVDRVLDCWLPLLTDDLSPRDAPKQPERAP